jgi:hypothetical protein
MTADLCSNNKTTWLIDHEQFSLSSRAPLHLELLRRCGNLVLYAWMDVFQTQACLPDTLQLCSYPFFAVLEKRQWLAKDKIKPLFLFTDLQVPVMSLSTKLKYTLD